MTGNEGAVAKNLSMELKQLDEADKKIAKNMQEIRSAKLNDKVSKDLMIK